MKKKEVEAQYIYTTTNTKIIFFKTQKIFLKMNYILELLLQFTFITNTLQTFFDNFRLKFTSIKSLIFKCFFRKNDTINLFKHSYSKDRTKFETHISFSQIFSTKNLNNVILDKKNYDEIINDIEKFKSNKNYYYKYGIPYKRCYYLYGLPGTGKTSIIKVIGKHYNLDIHSLQFDDFKLEKIIDDLPHNDCIILIDEFYNSYINREKYFNLLQYIDGIHENHNMIIFICSNDINQHLDEKNKSLFRPGRVDVISYFGYATEQQVKDMIKFYYNEEINIDKKIKNIFPSEITGYFLKGLSTNDILDKIIENCNECNESNVDESNVDEKLKKQNKETKRLSEEEKIARMTVDEREIYLKRKLLTSELNLTRKRKKINTLLTNNSQDQIVPHQELQ